MGIYYRLRNGQIVRAVNVRRERRLVEVEYANGRRWEISPLEVERKATDAEIEHWLTSWATIVVSPMVGRGRGGRRNRGVGAGEYGLTHPVRNAGETVTHTGPGIGG